MSIKKLLLGLFTVTTLAAPLVSLGVSSNLFNAGGVGANVETKTGLGNVDAATTVGSVINVALSFLAVIGLVLCLYAGFLWMTAAGNDDQITKAKDILKATVIGLVLIFLAEAINLTVIYWLNDATGGGLDFSEFL